ncbi:hypothetical protein PVAP13_5KG551307 [Panicum virgatum]|uniref:Uncharacterized protein n=1 Tax=Panicum virgatum TaxID=38727 RepID=A0A8T0SQ86_PANVG|nr:hypothetical protein PVAP13_5KG551307 [Panicum virgatum]
MIGRPPLGIGVSWWPLTPLLRDLLQRLNYLGRSCPVRSLSPTATARTTGDGHQVRLCGDHCRSWGFSGSGDDGIKFMLG